MTHPSVWEGFGAEAAAYERGRPGYPDDAAAWLVEKLDLRPGRCVVDLAAGTGKLTRLLVPSGARVVAVEPADGMRAELVRAVPGVEAVAGRAEELPFPDGSADAVTVAQAFHWFATDEALTEIARVLRPGGRLALVWNVRDPEDPLQQALWALVEPLRPEEHRHATRSWRAVLEANPHFGPGEEARFAHTQRIDADALVDRVGSISFVATLPEPRRTELLARVRELAGGGEVEVDYTTELYAAELVP
ncbi:MAG: class I SAM-dependent methyltransferase [Gaiellaceae bacterium]